MKSWISSAVALEHRGPGVAQQAHLVPEVLAAFAQVVDGLEVGLGAERARTPRGLRGRRCRGRGRGASSRRGGSSTRAPGRRPPRSPRRRRRPSRRSSPPTIRSRSAASASRQSAVAAGGTSPLALDQRVERRQLHLGVAARREQAGGVAERPVLALEGLLAELLADQAQRRARLLQVFAGAVDRLGEARRRRPPRAAARRPCRGARRSPGAPRRGVLVGVQPVGAARLGAVSGPARGRVLGVVGRSPSPHRRASRLRRQPLGRQRLVRVALVPGQLARRTRAAARSGRPPRASRTRPRPCAARRARRRRRRPRPAARRRAARSGAPCAPAGPRSAARAPRRRAASIGTSTSSRTSPWPVFAVSSSSPPIRRSRTSASLVERQVALLDRRRRRSRPAASPRPGTCARSRPRRDRRPQRRMGRHENRNRAQRRRDPERVFDALPKSTSGC